MNYYLGPYQWINNSWQPPATTIGSIDLRNLTHMGTPVTPNGIGFFAATSALDGNYTLLGSGDCRDINSDSGMKSAWNSLLGYSPNGDKLVDLLYDHLTMGSDPEGINVSKPLMPDNGNLIIHLGGHSVIKSIQFRLGHSKETNQIISVLKNDYRKIREDALAGRLPIDYHRKVLGFWGIQFKVNKPQDIFIPNNLPKETPLDPSSTFTENFNGIDDGALGKQLTWVEGDVTTAWENRSNGAMRTGIGDGGGQIERTARCTSAVSSADHECEVEIVTFGDSGATEKNPRCGVATRYSSSVKDCYFHGIGQTSGLGDGPTSLHFPGKIVADVETGFGNQTAIHTIPLTLKGKINGSTFELFINGILGQTQTDTAITGNLFGGVWGFNNNVEDDLRMDDWSITDELPSPVAGAPALLVGLI